MMFGACRNTPWNAAPDVVHPLSIAVPCTSIVEPAISTTPPGNTKSWLAPPSRVSAPDDCTIMLPPPNDGSPTPAGRHFAGITGRLFGGSVEPFGHTDGIDSVASPCSMRFMTCGAVP